MVIVIYTKGPIRVVDQTLGENIGCTFLKDTTLYPTIPFSNFSKHSVLNIYF